MKIINFDDPNYLLRIKLVNNIPKEFIIDAYKKNTNILNKLLEFSHKLSNTNIFPAIKTALYWNFGLYANGRQLPNWLYGKPSFIDGLISQKKNNLIWIYEKLMRKANIDTLKDYLLDEIENVIGWINVEDYKKFYNGIGSPVLDEDELSKKPPGWEFLIIPSDPDYLLAVKLLNLISEKFIIDAYKQNTDTFNKLLEIPHKLSKGPKVRGMIQMYWNYGLYADGRKLPNWLYEKEQFAGGLGTQKNNNLIWIYEKLMRKANIDTLKDYLLDQIYFVAGWINVGDYKNFYERIGQPVIHHMKEKPPGFEFLKISKN